MKQKIAKYLLLVGVLVIAVGLLGVITYLEDTGRYPAPTASPSLTQFQKKLEKLSLSAQGCEGSCPAYDITVDATGKGTFVGRAFVGTEGSQSFTLLPAQVRELEDFIDDTEMMKLDDRYVTDPSFDMATFRLTITVGGQTKQIIYQRDTPQEVYELADLLRQMTGANGWISVLTY